MNIAIKTQKNPTSIGVDAYWLLTTKAKPFDLMEAIVDKGVSITTTLSKHSAVENLISNPEGRHHTKRAPIDRRDKISVRDINVRAARC